MYKIILPIFIFLLTGCATNAEIPDSGIKHIVLCWLNEPGNQAHVHQVIKTSKELTIIPGVLDLHAGTALHSEREIVDDSFDAGIVMSFRNNKEMNDYLNHPEHVRRVKNDLLPLCQRILVYDISY